MSFPHTHRNTTRAVLFVSLRNLRTRQYQPFQELVEKNVVLPNPVSGTLKFRFCIMFQRKMAILGNESDCCGGPELPMV